MVAQGYWRNPDETARTFEDGWLHTGDSGWCDPEEGEVPVAFVVTEPGEPPTEQELLAFMPTRIAQYKIRARIHFLESLPLTKSGKLDHLALKALAG